MPPIPDPIAPERGHPHTKFMPACIVPSDLGRARADTTGYGGDISPPRDPGHSLPGRRQSSSLRTSGCPLQRNVATMTRNDQQAPTEELLQEALFLQLESLSLIYALRMKLDGPDSSKRRKGTRISVPAGLPPFEPPQPADKNEPPFVPEGLHVVCMRCGYQWLPRFTHRPKQCASCNAPWWYPAQHRWSKGRKKS